MNLKWCIGKKVYRNECLRFASASSRCSRPDLSASRWRRRTVGVHLRHCQRRSGFIPLEMFVETMKKPWKNEKSTFFWRSLEFFVAVAIFALGSNCSGPQKRSNLLLLRIAGDQSHKLAHSFFLGIETMHQQTQRLNPSRRCSFWESSGLTSFWTYAENLRI